MQESNTALDATSAAIVDLLERYFDHIAARRLDDARAMLAPGAELVFPGGRVHSSVTSAVEDGRARYSALRQTRSQWNVCFVENGTTIAFVSGHVAGVNRHGVPFREVRFIDRITVRDGLIQRLEVWNDLDTSGVLERTASQEPDTPPA
jgi:ketosteroid isomerase-like protein